MRKCPKCGEWFSEHPATSRVDGSMICPDCGIREAMASMGVDKEEAERVVDVVHRHTFPLPPPIEEK